VGRESRSRRRRTQERQGQEAVAAATGSPGTDPEALLSRYGVEPIPNLPEPVRRFHLRIVTDVLEGYVRGPGADGVVGATGAWHRHHDGFAASRPDVLNFGGTQKRLACAPGCNHCCRSPVGVVAAEAVVVAEVVSRSCSAQARGELARRMAARRAEAERGDPLRMHLLCPLNVDGACMVYAVRPYNCRVFHSFDAEACERVFVAGEAERSLPIDPVRKQYDMLIATSARVAFEALKLDMRLLEFMAALEIALAAGDDRCARLAAGEDLFAGLPTISRPLAP